MADRQDRLKHFSTAALARAHVLVIGAGGLGSHIACGLARKGAGMIIIADFDTAESSNLNRQLFSAADIGKPKALALAKHAAESGFLGSRCIGHHVAFNGETAPRLLAGTTVCVCGVDNNETRRLASVFCRAQRIPCVHLGVNENADFAWAFIEQAGTGQPCVGCVFPRIAESAGDRQPCRPVAAALDILLVAAGIALYSVDSLVMGRQRGWNYRDVHLIAGSSESLVAVRAGCALCQRSGGRS